MFSDRARVRRRGRAQVKGGGVAIVRFPVLPGAVFLDTVRVSSSVGRVLRAESTPIERERLAIAEAAKLLDALDAVDDRIAALDDKRTADGWEIDLLQRLSPAPPVPEDKREGRKNLVVDVASWGKALDFIAQRANAARARAAGAGHAAHRAGQGARSPVRRGRQAEPRRLLRSRRRGRRDPGAARAAPPPPTSSWSTSCRARAGSRPTTCTSRPRAASCASRPPRSSSSRPARTGPTRRCRFRPRSRDAASTCPSCSPGRWASAASSCRSCGRASRRTSSRRCPRRPRAPPAPAARWTNSCCANGWRACRRRRSATGAAKSPPPSAVRFLRGPEHASRRDLMRADGARAARRRRRSPRRRPRPRRARSMSRGSFEAAPSAAPAAAPRRATTTPCEEGRRPRSRCRAACPASASTARTSVGAARALRSRARAARARVQRSLPAGGQRGRPRLRLPGADAGDDSQLGQTGPHPAGHADLPGDRVSRGDPGARHDRVPARPGVATTASGRCCAGRRPSSATASWSASARCRPRDREATIEFPLGADQDVRLVRQVVPTTKTTGVI